MYILKIAVLASAVAVANAALQTVTNWGANPSNLNAAVNIPANMKPNPAVVVGLHGCGGDGPGFAAGDWTSLSEKYGFIGIFPSATGGSRCWDVSSKESLKHDGGSDSLGVANLVKWAISQKGADPKRVYVTGFSSGGMMTNVMLATYPDLFAGGAAVAGVPYFCFGDSGRAASDISNVGTAQCPKGITKTAKEWGDLVRAAYPGFTGTRPPMMLWHGSADNLVYPQNLKEEAKQWCNVLGVSETPTLTDTLSGKSGWNRQAFGSKNAWGRYPVEAISVQGAGHGVPAGSAQEILDFWNLNGSAPVQASPAVSPATSPRVSPASVPSPATGNCQGKNAQCGGKSYTGVTCCSSGLTCQVKSEWYSQCV